MAEPRIPAWGPFEQLEATLGTAAAVLTSVRPPRDPGLLSTLDAADPGATAAWLAHASASASGVRPGPGAGAVTAPGAELQVIEEIGRGGMGVVFKAVQRSFGREVALKRATSDDPAQIEQFLSEARITGALEHANIVPVHQLRVPEGGPPEMVMKLLRGTSWRDLLHPAEGEGLDREAHLRVLLGVCNAVAYAHRRGVIHRDLKPENVMTDELGQIFVVDWGLAAGLDPDRCATDGTPFIGDVHLPAGTPGYMAPELASGDGAQQGVRTDVYLLGACLHEILTRRRRHEGTTMREVLERAIVSEPFAYDAASPRELAEICARATAPRPEDRYPDVESFRLAIEGFLAHREAHRLAEKGLAQVTRLREAITRFDAARREPAQDRLLVTVDHLERDVHTHHAEAQFALKHALDLWDGLREAREGLAEAHRMMLEHALATEDATLAARLAEDDEATARVAALRARLAARARELDALRESARRLDWTNLRGALGTIFIVGGVVGSTTVFSTRAVLHAHLAASLAINAAIWIASAGIIGVVAFVRLRRVQVPGSLVSPRLLGTWGAVGLAALMIGAINDRRPILLAHDMGYCALVIAIGFASMAFQTRLWLLIPAAAFFVGTLIITFLPDLGFEVIGALWLLVMSGVGVALKRGATLAAPEQGDEPA